MTLAVLALLGEVSAVQLERTTNQMSQQRWAPGKFYKPTRKGRLWYELDDNNERVMGSENVDFISPHDPDVGDAPEDMKRVGNDHEPRHNAKLSP